MESTCGLVDIRSNSKLAYSTTKEIGTATQDAMVTVGSGSATVIMPKWVMKKMSQKPELTGPTTTSAVSTVKKDQLKPTIFVFDLKSSTTDKPVFELCEHAGGVSSLAVFNSVMYSASFDKTIVAWDLKAPEGPAKITRLRGFGGAIHFALLDGGDKLFAGTRYVVCVCAVRRIVIVTLT